MSTQMKKFFGRALSQLSAFTSKDGTGEIVGGAIVVKAFKCDGKPLAEVYGDDYAEGVAIDIVANTADELELWQSLGLDKGALVEIPALGWDDKAKRTWPATETRPELTIHDAIGRGQIKVVKGVKLVKPLPEPATAHEPATEAQLEAMAAAINGLPF